MSTNNCPACGAPVGPNITECKYCGESITVNQPQPQPPFNQTSTRTTTIVNGRVSNQDFSDIVSNLNINVNQINNNVNNNADVVYTSNKSKTTAGILGILLGGFGIHKFYLGRIGWGIVYLLFSWTYIPALIGLIEGIIYLSSSEQSFHMKYGRPRSSR